MKLVTDIRKTILHQLTLPWTRQAEPEITTLLRHCVACSLDSPDQLQNKESFFEQTDQEGFGTIVAICELYRLTPKTKRHPLVKWIAMSMAYLVGLRSSPLRYASWEIIAATIEQDVANEQEMLMWIVRVLDAFIVYGNGHHQTCAIDILVGIADGLRCILGCLFGHVMCPAVTDDGIKMADTIYSMMHTIEIGNKHVPEQEQVRGRERNIERRLLTVTTDCFTSLYVNGYDERTELWVINQHYTNLSSIYHSKGSYALPKMGC